MSKKPQNGGIRGTSRALLDKACERICAKSKDVSLVQALLFDFDDQLTVPKGIAELMRAAKKNHLNFFL
jgi:hypothetical protein